MRWFTAGVLALVTILTAGPIARDALGVLIASDSFAISLARGDYTPNTSLVGQSPSAGASGFSGAWGNPPTDLFLPSAGGLTHPLLPDEALDGQLIVYGTQGSAGGLGTWNASRAIDYTPTDGNYYMSVLLRKDGETTRAELLAGLGQSMPAGEGVFDVAGSWIGFVDGGIEFFSGPGADLDRLLSSSETKVGETYMALLEFDYSTSGPDSVSASVYDSTAVRIAGRQYTDLDLDGQLGRFSVLTQDYGPFPSVDEFRFGTELGDVIASRLIKNPNHYYYEFIWDVDGGPGPGVSLATLELSALPATHEEVVSLTFTDMGQNIWGFPEIYSGTFDTTIGRFISDGEGGLISEDLFNDARIQDLIDTVPGSFTLEARPGKNFDDPIDALNGIAGLWRLLRAPEVDDPDPINTFDDWAKSKGYNPGDAMPRFIQADDAGIKSLDGIDEYNWNATPTAILDLQNNLLTRLEAGAFTGMDGLQVLFLTNNPLTTIEDGAFRGLKRLQELQLHVYSENNTTLTELNFAEAEFFSLVTLGVSGNVKVTRVSLKNASVNQQSLRAMFLGGFPGVPFIFGISELDGITELDLSGIDFASITDLAPLYVMDDVTDLWLVGTSNLDAFALDTMLDELATIEGTDVEGILHMTQADFNAFNAAGGGLLAAWHAEPGHHVQFVTIAEPATVLLITAASCFVLAWKRSFFSS